MFNALDEQGLYISPEQKEKVYGPTGLDIGAETAEEIALSVMAEIKAAMCDRRGGLLRDRMEDIHVRTIPVTQ